MFGGVLLRDIYLSFINPKASAVRQVLVGRITLVFLFLFGFLIALRPISTLVAITTSAFTGIGVLYPTTLAALYWKRATKWGAISSVLVGETVSILLIYKILPSSFNMGSLPILPGIICALAALIGVSYFTPPPDRATTAKFVEVN